MSEIPYGYAELVGAATVGLAQRPLDVRALAGPAGGHAGVLPSGDPAGAVLAAAALFTAARRAGQLPSTLGAAPGAVPDAAVPGVAGGAVAGAGVPGAAPADVVPELSPRAGAVLAAAVHLNNPGLLAALLAVTAEAGFRAPAPLLPALLNAALRGEALRPWVVAVLGQRGRWLAAQRPAWGRIGELADSAGAVRDDADEV